MPGEEKQETSTGPVIILACWCRGEKLEMDGSLSNALGNSVLIYSDLMYLRGAVKRGWGGGKPSDLSGDLDRFPF